MVRIDGFSSPDQYDDEALSLWTHENYEDDELDLETSKYILDIIGDKFCQLVTSEKTAMSWVKKDGKEPSKLSRVLQFFLYDHCFVLHSSPPRLLDFPGLFARKGSFLSGPAQSPPCAGGCAGRGWAPVGFGVVSIPSLASSSPARAASSQPRPVESQVLTAANKWCVSDESPSQNKGEEGAAQVLQSMC